MDKKQKLSYHKSYNKKYYEINKEKLKFKKQLRLNKNLKEDREFLKFLDYYFLDESLSLPDSESESGS